MAAASDAAVRGDGLRRWANASWGLIHAPRGRTHYVRRYADDTPFTAAYADPSDDGSEKARGELGSGPPV